MIITFCMPVISCPEYIKCSFDLVHRAASIFDTGKLDVFYAETKDLIPKCQELKNYLTGEEQSRANRFHSEKDRETYILCHASLRLVLAQYLNLKPIEVAYKTVFNNKPGLMGNPVHFNLTHTREAFAFAVSGDYCIGIDLEDINQNMDIYSVAKSSFSEKERDYIFKSEKRARDRFFLLWTRKEALLKAIGTGITDDLTAIEVCDKENIIDPKLFTTFNLDITSAEYYIYSKKISNSYLSVAVSHQIKYNFHHLKEETFVSFINSKF